MPVMILRLEWFALYFISLVGIKFIFFNYYWKNKGDSLVVSLAGNCISSLYVVPVMVSPFFISSHSMWIEVVLRGKRLLKAIFHPNVLDGFIGTLFINLPFFLFLAFVPSVLISILIDMIIARIVDTPNEEERLQNIIIVNFIIFGLIIVVLLGAGILFHFGNYPDYKMVEFLEERFILSFFSKEVPLLFFFVLGTIVLFNFFMGLALIPILLFVIIKYFFRRKRDKLDNQSLKKQSYDVKGLTDILEE